MPSAMSRKPFAFLIILFFFLSFSCPAFSEDDAKQKLKELEESIKSQKKKLSEIKLYESSVLGELEKTNSELLGAEKELRKQKELLGKTDREIAALRAEISILEARISSRKEWMRRKLRAVHRYGNMGDTLLLLSSASDTGQLMRRIEYLRRLASYERKLIEGFRADLGALQERRASYDDLYSKLKKEEASVKKTASSLAEKKDKKERMLASVKKEKDSYQKLIREMEDASRKLIEIIRRSEEEEVAAGVGFRGRKSKLDWPVSGRLAVPYGKQKDPRWSATVFRNGIYITTAAGAQVRPVFGGKVVFAEWFKGYGQLVIVNHGDGYHSLYANLSEIFLGVGDIINKDTVIGRVGESVMLSSPSLYFEIRYKGKPLDPTQWLKER